MTEIELREKANEARKALNSPPTMPRPQIVQKVDLPAPAVEAQPTIASVMPEAPAPVIAAAPAISAPVKVDLTEKLITLLLGAPDQIAEAQAEYDGADRLFKAQLTRLSIEALSKPIFPGKKDGDPMRFAGNDAERDLAVQQVIGTDHDMIRLAQRREDAVRKLAQARNTLDVARIVAGLIHVN